MCSCWLLKQTQGSGYFFMFGLTEKPFRGFRVCVLLFQVSQVNWHRVVGIDLRVEEIFGIVTQGLWTGLEGFLAMLPEGDDSSSAERRGAGPC